MSELLKIIKEKNITNKEIASTLKVTPSTVVKLLNGELALTVERKEKIEKLLGTKIDNYLEIYNYKVKDCYEL